MAAEIQADLLILMSDVDGIYNKPPWEDGAKMMSTYTTNDRDQIQFGEKSKVGSVASSFSPTLFLSCRARFQVGPFYSPDFTWSLDDDDVDKDNQSCCWVFGSGHSLWTHRRTSHSQFNILIKTVWNSIPIRRWAPAAWTRRSVRLRGPWTVESAW